LERRLHDGAVGVVGNERRERALALRDRVVDRAVDVGLGQEAQQVDAARRHVGVGGKGNHRHAALARDLRDSADRDAEQRPEDDLGAFRERLLGGGLCALRGAAIVLHQELDVGIAEFGERHLGGIAHRLRRKACIAGTRERQDERDLDLTGADRRGCAGGGGGGLPKLNMSVESPAQAATSSVNATAATRATMRVKRARAPRIIGRLRDKGEPPRRATHVTPPPHSHIVGEIN